MWEIMNACQIKWTCWTMKKQYHDDLTLGVYFPYHKSTFYAIFT